MSDTEVAELLKLPVEERLRLMEVLWESLSAEPLPLGPAHKAILDARLSEYLRNPNDVVSRDAVFDEARKG
jgi:putative addiction module component (TIGR02574 family)